MAPTSSSRGAVSALDAAVAQIERIGRDVTAVAGDVSRLADLDRLATTTGMALELYEQMLALYPDRVNPGALWSSARALKG